MKVSDRPFECLYSLVRCFCIQHFTNFFNNNYLPCQGKKLKVVFNIFDPSLHPRMLGTFTHYLRLELECFGIITYIQSIGD